MNNGVGSHATTKTRYNSITSNGFQASETGRRGKGIYFWYGSCKNCSFARSLALSWYTAAEKRGDYNRDSDKSGVIVWADIKSEESQFLDITTAKYQTMIRQLLDKHLLEHNIRDSDTKGIELAVSSVHDLVVERVERLGCQIKVVLASIAAPKMDDRLKPYLSNPFAYVVRDSSCIELDLDLTEEVIV